MLSFKEELQRLSVQIIERKEHITNEEMTKQALIIPFFQVLGYDIFSPLEVKSEYISDFGKKKGEKVDYAIFKDGKPIIFIEAKAVTENLASHDSQLARYFNATPEVKLAILTNGIIYKFFTDVDANNIMDENPFAIIDIIDLSPNDIEVLARFKKESFETESLVKYAEDLIYTSNLNTKLKELFKNPSDDFIRYLIKDFSDSRITSNVVERFRPIVKKSISNAILDIVSQGIFQQEAAPTEDDKPIPIINEDSSDEEQPIKQQATTTEEELKAFEIIKNILETNGKNISELQYKDTLNYFGIHFKSIYNWFMRLRLDNVNKNMIIRLPVETVKALSDCKAEQASKAHGENSSQVFIQSIDDLKKLDRLIIKCYDEVMAEI